MPSSICFPTCNNILRYEINFKRTFFITIYDDLFDLNMDGKTSFRGMEQIIRRLEDESSESIVSWNPLIIGLYLTIKEMFDTSNEVQQRRIIFLLKEYYEGIVEEKNIDGCANFLNLEEYLKVPMQFLISINSPLYFS